MEVIKRLYMTHMNDLNKNKWDNPEFQAAKKLIESHNEYLRQKLMGDDQQRLRELDDLQEEMIEINDYECFHSGFRDGVNLMAEMLCGNGKFIRQEYPFEV